VHLTAEQKRFAGIQFVARNAMLLFDLSVKRRSVVEIAGVLA
jgi:hypothetical protein